MIPVAHNGGKISGVMKDLCIFRRKGGKLPYGGIFSENNTSLGVCEDFKGVPLTDPQGPADFLRDDHPPQIIDSADDSCGFHLSIPPFNMFSKVLLFSKYL